MRPAHDGGILKGPHVYVKRADGSSGYEPAPQQDVIFDKDQPLASMESLLPSQADLDAIADEQKVKEATSKKAEKSWGTAKPAKS